MDVADAKFPGLGLILRLAKGAFIYLKAVAMMPIRVRDIAVNFKDRPRSENAVLCQDCDTRMITDKIGGGAIWFRCPKCKALWPQKSSALR